MMRQGVLSFVRYRTMLVGVLCLAACGLIAQPSFADEQTIALRKGRLAALLATVPPRVNLTDQQIQQVADRMMAFPTVLPQTFFDGDQLHKDVRDHSLAFAHARFRDLRMPELKIIDVLFVGSLASYEYDDLSDVDVHIIIDPKSFAGDASVLRRYLNAMNDLNEFLYANLTIHGRKADFSFYADTIERRIEPGVGLYSLSENQWLNRPEPAPVRFSKDVVYRDLLTYVKRYNDLVDLYRSDKRRFACDRFSALREDIRLYRREGIAKNGLRSSEDIVYRAMRRMNGNLLTGMEALKQECVTIQGSLP